MNIQELIDELQKIPDKSLPVCLESEHEYWGTVNSDIFSVDIDDHAQPDGPKQGCRRAVILR